MKIMVVGFEKDGKQRIMLEDSCMHYTTAFAVFEHTIKKDFREIYRKKHGDRFSSGIIDLDCINVSHTMLTDKEARKNMMKHAGFPDSLAESVVLKTDAIITVVCSAWEDMCEYYILCGAKEDDGEKFTDIKEWMRLFEKESDKK